MVQFSRIAFGILLLCVPILVQAQQSGVSLSGLKQDPGLPVELAADQLTIDQATGIATFSGKVVITQGAMKLSADQVVVEYLQGESGAKGKISRLIASGGVLMVTSTEAAQAADAVYSVATGEIVMTGNVVLTQGSNALSGQKLVVNLNDGTARVEGRVTTTLQTGGTSP
jgi:lipopolysaccharide export system protein LptA